MKWRDSHPSDQELLQAADGELPEKRTKDLQVHLAACWSCRARARELEDAITAYVRLHYQTHDPLCSSRYRSSRALLKARLASLDESPNKRLWFDFGNCRNQAFQVSVVSLAVICIVIFAFSRWMERKGSPQVVMLPITVPNGTLTPGAAAIVTREQVCGEALDNNRRI